MVTSHNELPQRIRLGWGSFTELMREMPPRYFEQLLQQGTWAGFIWYDQETIPRATLEDLEPELWERFRDPCDPDDSPAAFLSRLGMAKTDEDGSMRPTVAGVLMASADPRQWLPNAFIQAVAYQGTTTVPTDPSPLDAADITGPLDVQVADACRFVVENMRDASSFDMTAVFEALVNAVAHRDYSIQTVPIRLRLFPDRLELYSPGMPPDTIDVASLPFRQSSRNDATTRLLARCPLPEDIPHLMTDRPTFMFGRGEGVAFIFGNSEQLSGQRPEYRLLNDELLLTIYAPNSTASGEYRG